MLRAIVVFLSARLTASLYDASLDFITPQGLAAIPDQRAHLCQQAQAVLNGSLAIRDALVGVHLTMVTPLYDPPFFDEPIGNTDPALMTGLHAALAAELATSAGFSYTIISHPLSSFEPDLSWTQYLDRASGRFDLVLDWWLHTGERTAMGLANPFPFLDLSLIPAKRTQQTTTKFSDLMAICPRAVHALAVVCADRGDSDDCAALPAD